MTEKKRELLQFIESLTEEEAQEIIDHLPLFGMLASSEDASLAYSETLLSKMFGKA